MHCSCILYVEFPANISGCALNIPAPPSHLSLPAPPSLPHPAQAAPTHTHTHLSLTCHTCPLPASSSPSSFPQPPPTVPAPASLVLHLPVSPVPLLLHLSLTCFTVSPVPHLADPSFPRPSTALPPSHLSLACLTCPSPSRTCLTKTCLSLTSLAPLPPRSPERGRGTQARGKRGGTSEGKQLLGGEGERRAGRRQINDRRACPRRCGPRG